MASCDRGRERKRLFQRLVITSLSFYSRQSSQEPLDFLRFRKAEAMSGGGGERVREEGARKSNILLGLEIRGEEEEAAWE